MVKRNPIVNLWLQVVEVPSASSKPSLPLLPPHSSFLKSLPQISGAIT